MKRFISLLFVLIMCLTVTTSAFASVTDMSESNTPISVESSEEPTRAEETEWYTRTTPDGLIQARLWSITYGYWKTDWITIGHV